MSVHLPRGAPAAAAAAFVALAALLLPLQASAQPAAGPQWSTYIGGGDRDRIMAIAQNSNRDVAVVGRTFSLDFANPPTAGARTNSEIFVAGFDSDLFPISQFPLRMVGGPGDDDATAVAIAPDNAVYIVGQTSSASMTGAGAKVGTLQSTKDAFLIRINGDGTPDWYMYLGGTADDAATGVTFIGGSLYVSGSTSSDNFMGVPTDSNPSPGSVNAFVVRVDLNTVNPRSAPTVGWGGLPRIIGGLGNDFFHGITAGSNGVVVAAGTTSSLTDSLGAIYGAKLKNAYKGGASDAFVVELATATGEPRWLTYVGGSGTDEGKGVATGAELTFVVAGNTTSTDLPGNTSPAGTNVFGAWVSYEGFTRLIQVRGGGRDEEVLAVTTDSNGTAYIGGRTGSSSFPRISLGFDTQIEAEPAQAPYTREGFVWMLPGWGGPGWDSFAGGSGMDEVTALAVQTSTQLMVGMMTGSTTATGLPGDPTNRDSTLNGANDGYLLAVKINEPNPPQEGMVFDRPQFDLVLEDVPRTTSRTSIFANWTEFRYGSAALTSGYEWAIGTPEEPTKVQPFGPTTEPLRAMATGLPELTVGQTYVVTVRAQNRVGLTMASQSDGVLVTDPDGGVGETDGGPVVPDGGIEEPPADGGAIPDGGTDGGIEGPGEGPGDGKDDGKESPLGWGCASTGGVAVPLFLGLIALLTLSRKRGQPSR